jgi:hypothetical protein
MSIKMILISITILSSLFLILPSVKACELESSQTYTPEIITYKPYTEKKINAIKANNNPPLIAGAGIVEPVTSQLQISPDKYQGTPIENSLVSYITPSKIYSEVRIVPNPQEPYSTTYDFYKVGDIINGQYNGGELVLVYVNYPDGPCKGSGCNQPQRLRYILFNKTAIFLPKISQYEPGYGTDKTLSRLNPFQKFGFTLAQDNSLTIPILEYPKTLTGNSPRQLLQLAGERDGQPNVATLMKISSNQIFGDIYTTKSGVSLTKDFYYNQSNNNSDEPMDANACAGNECFLNNGFYVFRPDGTFLEYYYKPDFSMSDVLHLIPSGYDYSTRKGCDGALVNYSSIVSDSAVHNGEDLIVTGYTHSKDPVYTFKDTNHPLIKEFYQSYQQTFIKLDYERSDPNSPRAIEAEWRTAYTKIRTYDQFIAAKPILLWRDPFGRLVRFSNVSFLPPIFCEPIIYLYPQKEQEVNIRLNPIIHITDSAPVYLVQWDIVAEPSGEIINLADNRKYPYLFWEGWSLIFETPRQGFVVRKTNISIFLKDILPKLGLNDKEKNDFIKAWSPQLSSAPYYFITFIDQKNIDQLAPLDIHPRPQTIIRVLMDYKPLYAPIDVQPLSLPNSVSREGFTVVEWGALKR